MPTQIKLPNLGENIDSGDVLTIFVSEGDTIKANQDLLEIETDKATMPVPSPEGGKIVKVLVSEGDTVAVGAPIIEIESAAAEKKADKKKPPAKEKTETVAARARDAEAEPTADEAEAAEQEAVEEEPKPARPAAKKSKRAEPEEEPAEEAKPRRRAAQAEVAADIDAEDESEVAPEARPLKATRTATAARAARPPDDEDVPGDGHAAAAAGPAVRRLARQLGVELRRVRPTGAGGRITAEDVRAHVRETNEQVAAGLPQGVTPPGAADVDEYGAVRIEKLSRMRQTIAKNMVDSYTTIPQLTNFDDVDVTELEDMRQQSKDDYGDRGIKLTAMPFLIKAVASSLKRHPVLNASVDTDNNEIIYKEYVHIGIAVDTEKGLVVPVLRDADRKSIAQIATELDELATSARTGKFKIEDLRGGTFTISNLGSVGGIYSTPIINPPQVGILLAGRARIMPLIIDDAVEQRLVMPLSITYDHRLVDGAAAQRFLNEVKGYLSAPGRLLLAP
jgi:pyruvate dehydrogenase E2 component (dihydrolipoamide acetyltransferase)